MTRFRALEKADWASVMKLANEKTGSPEHPTGSVEGARASGLEHGPSCTCGHYYVDIDEGRGWYESRQAYEARMPDKPLSSPSKNLQEQRDGAQGGQPK